MDRPSRNSATSRAGLQFAYLFEIWEKGNFREKEISGTGQGRPAWEGISPDFRFLILRTFFQIWEKKTFRVGSRYIDKERDFL